MSPSSHQDMDNFPRSQALGQCIREFSERALASATLTDGVLTARVVGEFSAGKTRLLRELFGEMLPEPLLPISSLERQTRLQLEVTHGNEPGLALVKREADYRPAEIVETLERFPDRAEVLNYDPMQYRLRLSVPEPWLILTDGDGFTANDGPKRLFLIDTPGWNSGDDELAEREASSVLMGHHNLALVYVCQASRLDGVLNAERLREFVEALAAAEFLDQTKLLFIITSCPTTDAAGLESRARSLVLCLWSELGHDPNDLDLDVFCVDFQDMSVAALQHFRESFWKSLLGPLSQSEVSADPMANALRRWPPHWDIRPQLRSSAQMLARVEILLRNALKDDEFIAGMSMYRLMGLTQVELRKRVMSAWLKQLDCDPSTLEDWTVEPLSEDHPLANWWQSYWLPALAQALAPIRNFFAQARQSINALTSEVKDLKKHLHAALAHSHAEAVLALDGSFACLIRTAQELLGEPAAEKRVATLLTLSMLQARYEDYYAQHVIELSGEAA